MVHAELCQRASTLAAVESRVLTAGPAPLRWDGYCSGFETISTAQHVKSKRLSFDFTCTLLFRATASNYESKPASACYVRSPPPPTRLSWLQRFIGRVCESRTAGSCSALVAGPLSQDCVCGCKSWRGCTVLVLCDLVRVVGRARRAPSSSQRLKTDGVKSRDSFYSILVFSCQTGCVFLLWLFS